MPIQEAPKNVGLSQFSEDGHVGPNPQMGLQVDVLRGPSFTESYLGIRNVDFRDKMIFTEEMISLWEDVEYASAEIVSDRLGRMHGLNFWQRAFLYQVVISNRIVGVKHSQVDLEGDHAYYFSQIGLRAYAAFAVMINRIIPNASFEELSVFDWRELFLQTRRLLGESFLSSGIRVPRQVVTKGGNKRRVLRVEELIGREKWRQSIT